MAPWPPATEPTATRARQAALCVTRRIHPPRRHPRRRPGRAGREALLRYILRPPIAQERVELRPDGLVRIALKRAYTDGTVAVEMDPLSLLCRLAASVPPPRHHIVRYAGVLASASPLRPRIAPPRAIAEIPVAETPTNDAPPKRAGGTYRPWAELLKRTFTPLRSVDLRGLRRLRPLRFDVDVLHCPKCNGRMKLVAMVTNPVSIARYLAKLGELADVPPRAPSRGPPYWKSTVLRRKALGDVA